MFRWCAYLSSISTNFSIFYKTSDQPKIGIGLEISCYTLNYLQAKDLWVITQATFAHDNLDYITSKGRQSQARHGDMTYSAYLQFWVLNKKKSPLLQHLHV